MYCGSCLRDNRLAATLIAQGRDVVLLPLYTPIRTDEADVSVGKVLFGGLGVYLRQKSALFRSLPPWSIRPLNSRFLLRLLGRVALQTRAEDLGELTVSVLQASAGPQEKAVAELVAALRPLRPGLIHLPNLMFVGIADALKSALGVPVVCSLSGEDVFIDRLIEPFQSQSVELIRAAACDVDAYVAPTRYFATFAASRFGLPAERVHCVPMGVHVDDFEPAEPPDGPFVIGYLARICREKGLAVLAEAFVRLRTMGHDCRLRVAGYFGPDDQRYYDDVHRLLRRAGVLDHVEFVAEVDRRRKIEFLRSLHLFSVPAVYHEAKGLYVLESMAAGVPVVEPRHGSFTELIEATGGGVLYEPNTPDALAGAIAGLIDDEERRRELGARGREGTRGNFSDKRMAEETWALYERIAAVAR
jgi:glycosyltransferase involved in cell wall biosynthesis